MLPATGSTPAPHQALPSLEYPYRFGLIVPLDVVGHLAPAEGIVRKRAPDPIALVKGPDLRIVLEGGQIHRSDRFTEPGGEVLESGLANLASDMLSTTPAGYFNITWATAHVKARDLAGTFLLINVSGT